MQIRLNCMTDVIGDSLEMQLIFFMETTLKTKNVGDLMTKEVFTVQQDRTWHDAARKLSSKMVHHLVIVDGNHHPLGIVSSQDFVYRTLGGDSPESFAQRKISDHLKAGVLKTVKTTDSLYDAANLMKVHHIDCVVVLGPAAELAGILTARDVMEAALDLTPI